MNKRTYKAIKIKEDDISYIFEMLEKRKSKTFNGWDKGATVRLGKKYIHGLITATSIEFIDYIIEF